MMSILRAGLALACLLGAAAPLAAQGTVRASGRVARLLNGDTVGVAGARVVLHRIGREVQGPVDSVLAGPDGRFVVQFPRDTTALHLLSSRNAGIEYFSAPLALNPARPDTALLLMVHDTSVDAPVELDGRNIVISKAGDDGARRVLELLVIRNAGDKARVAPDTVQPSWSMRLPAGVVGFSVGPGDISSEAVLPRGDSVLVFAPLAPGDKQLVFEYAIPGDRDNMAVPFSSNVRSLNVLVEDDLAELNGLSLAAGAVDTVQGKPYRRFSGSAAAGDELRVRWPDPRREGRLILGGLVGVMAAAVVFLTLRALRRPRRQSVAASPLVSAPRSVASSAPPAEAAAAVIDQLAALDATHAGRQAEFTADEWARYLAAREQLLARAVGTVQLP